MPDAKCVVFWQNSVDFKAGVLLKTLSKLVESFNDFEVQESLKAIGYIWASKITSNLIGKQEESFRGLV